MSTTADLRPGLVIKYNNDPCIVVESEHRTPGNLRAFYQVKMRNLRTGRLLENRFRSGEALEILRIERRELQYLYRDGAMFVFMDNESYEQIFVDGVKVDGVADLLKESNNAVIAFNDTEVMSVELPQYVVLRIVETEPGIKGDTVNNTLKPAKVETGATIMVPLFVNEGELIRIDTEKRSYMERVKE
jgi:elongation factor P